MFRIRRESSYIFFLALICITPPLSTDMYLAAIPHIAEEWGVAKELVNLSLVLWFVSFSLCMLVYGRISDMVGRRPVLLGGLLLFSSASLLCMTATNVRLLVLFRILQGTGAAAPSAMAMAICRDRYDGYMRQKVLAYVGIIIAVAPMVSPMIGAVLLSTGSWRLIFLVQGLMGLFALVISLGYAETAAELARDGFWKIFGRYWGLIKNREYMLTNVAMGLNAGPFYAFIAFSPIAYIVHFGLSEEMFSLLFGANALAIMLGSFASTRMSRRYSGAMLLTMGFSACLASGLGILLFASRHYLAFAGFMFALSFFIGVNRPVSSSLILEQVDRDIGAASSFAIFYQFMAGAILMALVTLNWKHPFLIFSLAAAGIPALILGLWPFLLKLLTANGSLKRLDGPQQTAK